MALDLLQGTSGNVDISVNGISLKCILSYWSADFAKEMGEQTTFCSSNWAKRNPGKKQVTGRADGGLGKNAAGADPTDAWDSDVAVPFVLTADTGCTFTFSGHVTHVHAGVRAATAATEFSFDFESYGAVVTVWDEA